MYDSKDVWRTIIGRGRQVGFAFCLLAIVLLSAWARAVTPTPVVLGVERPEIYLPLLQNARVGLVVNQASLSHGAHTIDILRARGVNLIKLFALEHGLRGDGGAGEGIPDSVDPETGLPIISLYGTVYKPTPAMLSDIDVIVFDIQDVGVRFYTYISSLGLIMEAAAENGKRVMVLDRPNPNGDYVDGPMMRQNNISFVGAFPIPLVYGLTVGELATMIHFESWKLTPGLRLDIVPMADYRRGEIYTPEGLPSSGLKTINAMRSYASLALFEPTIISVGKGTDDPYTQFGIPDERIGPHTFVPQPRKPGQHPMYEGQTCYGEEFIFRPAEQVPHFTTDIFVNALKKVRKRPFVTDKRFLRLLVGDDLVVEDMLKGRSYAQIRKRFEKDLADFSIRRQKYLLY